MEVIHKCFDDGASAPGAGGGVAAAIRGGNSGREGQYLSHRLALPLASYADVAREGGHNEIVLRRYYERRVTAREARAYLALTPSRV